MSGEPSPPCIAFFNSRLIDSTLSQANANRFPNGISVPGNRLSPQSFAVVVVEPLQIVNGAACLSILLLDVYLLVAILSSQLSAFWNEDIDSDKPSHYFWALSWGKMNPPYPYHLMHLNMCAILSGADVHE